MYFLKALVTLLSRILMAAYFIPAGMKVMKGLAGWIAYYQARSSLLPGLTQSFPRAFVLATFICETGFGLALLIGLATRQAALLLILFVVAWNLLYHSYWTMPEELYGAEQVNFYKNCAIIGGLLLITVYGAGRFSLDALLHRWRSIRQAERLSRFRPAAAATMLKEPQR